jgi:glutathione synthase/RimK-type ligase-like ATP-grasp enzyme
MKNRLAIYFSSPGAYDYPLNKKVYLESYSEMIDLLEDRGIEVAIVRGDSYRGNGYWSSCFMKKDSVFTKIDEEWKCDLIWNRDDKNTFPMVRDCAVLNNIEFDELCRDKLKTADVFKDFSMQTILLNSYDDYLASEQKIVGEMVVLKPRYGEQAVGVYVVKKEDVQADLYDDWRNILLQEFADSRRGLPKLASGVHEINVYIVDGNFAGARVKIPPEGSFVTGYSTGTGTVKGISFDEMPDGLWDVVTNVDRHMSSFVPRLYRADFVRTSEGYKLIEINSRPGLTHAEKEGKDYMRFNGAVIESICRFFRR